MCIGPTEFQLIVTNDDIGRVNFLWNNHEFDYIILYCTLENSPLIVFRGNYSSSSTSITLEESTTYTCYISGRNGSGL